MPCASGLSLMRQCARPADASRTMLTVMRLRQMRTPASGRSGQVIPSCRSSGSCLRQRAAGSGPRASKDEGRALCLRVGPDAAGVEAVERPRYQFSASKSVRPSMHLEQRQGAPCGLFGGVLTVVPVDARRRGEGVPAPSPPAAATPSAKDGAAQGVDGVRRSSS